MKFTYKILNTIKDIFKANKTVFVFMLVGLLASDIMLIYFFGNVGAYMNSSLEGVFAVRYVGRNNAGLDFESIEKLDFSDRGVTKSSVSAYVDSVGFILEGGGAVYDDESVLEIAAYFSGEPELVKFLGDCSFDNTDCKYPIILPCTPRTRSLSYDAESRSYGRVLYGNIAFTVIGVSTYVNTAIVPYSVFKELFAPEYAYYYTDTVLPQAQSESLTEAVFSAYGCENDGLIDPYAYYRAARRDYGFLMFAVFLMYTASLLAFLFYVRFFTYQSARESAVARICGAGRGRLKTELIITNELLALGCFIVALMVAIPCFGSFDIFASVSYSARDIINMFAIIIISTFTALLPSLRTLDKTTAAELAKGVK